MIPYMTMYVRMIVVDVLTIHGNARSAAAATAGIATRADLDLAKRRERRRDRTHLVDRREPSSSPSSPRDVPRRCRSNATRIAANSATSTTAERG